MPRAALGTLPFGPLLGASELVGELCDALPVVRTFDDCAPGSGFDGVPLDREGLIGRLAERLGCTMRSVHRYVVHGVPVRTADDLCCALNLNPVEVWGDDWWRP